MFEGLMKQFRDEFYDLSRTLQEGIQNATATYLRSTNEAMEILRGDESLGQSAMDIEYYDAIKVATATAQSKSQTVVHTIGEF